MTATVVPLLRTLAGWAHQVTCDDVPADTIAATRSQLISDLAAVRASLAHPAGRRIVAAFGPPTQSDPTRAAYVLAAMATMLDFDEVAYSGHPSAGAVNVAVAEAGPNGLDGRALLAAIVAATECASRITAATILSGFFRGQTNTHTHLAGAAAARLHARGASLPEWVAGLGLALGTLAVPLHHGVVTSDVKAFSAAVPVRMALDACDAAGHGLSGPDTILEHPEGMLAYLSAVPLPDAVTAGLGIRWHTDTLTYKRFPGSAYLHSAIDCAERLHRALGPLGPDQVDRVVVSANLLTWQLQRKVAGVLAGPRTSVSAATLSVGYGVATMLLSGGFGPRDLDPSRIADERRWALADKVVVEHDWDLSVRMASATSPLGEALRQAGNRAMGWPDLLAWCGDSAGDLLRSLGEPEKTFERATMAIGARVAIELTDGGGRTEATDSAIGQAGPGTRRDHRAIVREKFLATGGTAEVLAALEHVDRLDPATTAAVLRDALTLGR